MPAVKDILSALPNLPPTALQQVKARAVALLGTEQASDEDERFVFDQMHRTLEEAGAPAMPWSLFTKARFYAAFKTGVPVLLAFMEQHFKPKHRLERIKVAGILLDILVQRMRDRRVPVTMQSLTHRLCEVHLAVDRAFPGYTESGMLRWVVDHYQVGAI